MMYFCSLRAVFYFFLFKNFPLVSITKINQAFPFLFCKLVVTIQDMKIRIQKLIKDQIDVCFWLSWCCLAGKQDRVTASQLSSGLGHDRYGHCVVYEQVFVLIQNRGGLEHERNVLNVEFKIKHNVWKQTSAGDEANFQRFVFCINETNDEEERRLV